MSNKKNQKDKELRKILSRDLQTQWKDHFHMRNQMWRTTHLSILFFISVIGLELSDKNGVVILLATLALLFSSISGFIVVLHLRKRQKVKFEIIRKIEEELGTYNIIKNIVENSNNTWFEKLGTSFYILIIHASFILISVFLFIYYLVKLLVVPIISSL